MELLLSALAAYLIGSIPFGLLLTRVAGLGDIRAIGSGNIGATNVLRTGNKKLAALTLLLDGLKGFAAVALANVFLSQCDASAFATVFGNNDMIQQVCADHMIAPGAAVLAFIGLLALVGHIFPVWLKFKGGKGVATSIGVAFGLSWVMGLLCCLIWLAMAAAFRYSSLSALVAIGLLPILGAIVGLPAAILPLALIALLVIYRHKDNIKRLRAGTEPKIGKKHDAS